MLVALELDENNIIKGTAYIANEDYTELLENDSRFTLAEVDSLDSIIEYKTKYENGQIVQLDDYDQIFYEKLEREEQISNINSQLAELNNWFNEYDMQVKQYERDIRLGIVGTYHIGDNEYTIQQLDNLANEKAGIINELREELKEINNIA